MGNREYKSDVFSMPHFVVFYNGTEKRPEKEIQYLSDAFQKKIEEPELEVKVTVYNINVGQNESLLQKCQVLREYMIFVDKVRTYVAKKVELGEAIDISIHECIEEHVLEDFLRRRRDEVTKVMTLDYTWERREELIREEERAEGRAEGREEGRAEGRAEGREEGRIGENIRLIKMKLQKNKSVEQIAEELEDSEEHVKALIAEYNL